MLTITSPIKTALNPDMAAREDGFARRIMANYDQMSAFITREDLFHVVTQPPEIFMIDDGGNSYLSETEIRNTQLKKVNIINNLMNRILVSANGDLHYQDEVYITNILHKLGIRDERTFMDKVYELTEQTNENKRLTKTYIDNLEKLSSLVSFYQSNREETRSEYYTEDNEEILHLHNDVFNRWMTGQLYQMQQDFRTVNSSVTSVNSDSYRMTEEQRLSNQLLLQVAREYVRDEAVPLIWRHENYYEMPGEEEAQAEREEIASQIASAVLLNLVDNLYENIASRTEIRGDRYYNTEAAYYQAGDNVFERMEGNTSYLISLHRNGDINAAINEQSRNEITALTEMLSYYQSSGDEIINEYTEVETPVQEALIYKPEPVPEDTAPFDDIHVDQRNSLEQQIYQMNLKNEERRKEYINNLERISTEAREAARITVSEDDKRSERLLALTDPEALKETFAKRQELDQQNVPPQFSQEYIESLPRTTREVLQTIDEYITQPERFVHSQKVQVGSEQLLLRESLEAEREQYIAERERILETTEHATDTVRNVADTSERLIYDTTVRNLESEERIHDISIETVNETQRINTIRQENLRTQNDIIRSKIIDEARESVMEHVRAAGEQGMLTAPESVHFVHKTNDVTIDEETIDNLRQEISRVRNDTTKLQTKVESNETVTETQINNYNEQTIKEENTEEITRLIQTNINKQLGYITGKVYDRIEHRLQNERSRRGR